MQSQFNFTIWSATHVYSLRPTLTVHARQSTSRLLAHTATTRPVQDAVDAIDWPSGTRPKRGGVSKPALMRLKVMADYAVTAKQFGKFSVTALFKRHDVTIIVCLDAQHAFTCTPDAHLLWNSPLEHPPKWHCGVSLRSASVHCKSQKNLLQWDHTSPLLFLHWCNAHPQGTAVSPIPLWLVKHDMCARKEGEVFQQVHMSGTSKLQARTLKAPIKSISNHHFPLLYMGVRSSEVGHLWTIRSEANTERRRGKVPSMARMLP